ncbi:MAG: hypothetical protein C0402_12960 [Thermodesulfovibrio sp.]|nr:hypothetical protein [Thermodesulfovibrio sp.]
MNRKYLVILLTVAFVIGAFGNAFAVSSYLSSFSSTYPASTSDSFSCSLCHTSVPSRNPYGAAYGSGHNFSAIANLDSDGDGATNLAEINAGTNPGDPASKPTPPPPAACSSFTYSAWSACQSNNTQTRTVATKLPAGCTGNPPAAQLTQACTYVPPVSACTSFTYSAWNACQSNNTQTRTVASSMPAGCTGGSPLLTQICNYVPPVNACTSFTYSAWGACQSNSTQTRTVASSSPTGCTGGNPVVSQACTYVPPVTPPTGAMPLPTSEEKFSYDAVADPVVSNDPEQAKPIGVGPIATGGNTIDLKVNIGPFEKPATVSFFLYAPAIDSEDLYYLDRNYEVKKLSDTVGEIERESLSSNAVAQRGDDRNSSSKKFRRLSFWKTNVTGVNEQLYKGAFPPGYYALVLVVKSDDNDEDYYSWTTHFTVAKDRNGDDHND